jgi:hypothetical protein
MCVMEAVVKESTEVTEVANESRRVYRRDLPGAGFVAIDVRGTSVDARDGEAPSSPRIRVFVERRASEERRVGHEPPVLAECDGDDRAPELGELFRLAADNAALARALIAWQARRQKPVRAD